jgi:hypothetical protein
MSVFEHIGRLINYFIAGVAIFYAYVWLFNHISTGILKHFKSYDLLLDFAWHRKEFRAWMNERSGPKCDACGKRITEDQKNVGYECDLHEWCIERRGGN